MKPKIINVKGKPHLVIISYEEYLDLLEAAKQPNQLPAPKPKKNLHTKKVRVSKNADIPEEIQRRLLKGESTVKAWRLYRDLTQNDLAKLAGVSNSTVSLIENGQRRGTEDTYLALARALGVPVDVLFDE